jgi:hypothetical protein
MSDISLARIFEATAWTSLALAAALTLIVGVVVGPLL